VSAGEPAFAAGDAGAELTRWWNAQPYLAALDLKVASIEEGRARVVLHRSQVNVAGIRDSINGGVLASLAELAAHVALRSVLGEGGRVAHTQDLSISYTSSARSEHTVAEATVLRVGRLAVVDVAIAEGDDRGERTGALNCRARVSCVLER
jgi:uncharacterized protein (TIGR00369 family)